MIFFGGLRVVSAGVGRFWVRWSVGLASVLSMRGARFLADILHPQQARPGPAKRTYVFRRTTEHAAARPVLFQRREVLGDTGSLEWRF